MLWGLRTFILASIPDLLFHLVRNIGRELVHIVVTLRADEFRQGIDESSGLLDLGEAAPAGQAFHTVVAASRLAFAWNEGAHAGLPSASNTTIVTAPSMSVISAELNLPLA